MFRTRRARFIGASLTAAALSVAAAIPAQAASGTGWRVVSASHSGAAADANGLVSVVAPAADDAWAFGSNIVNFSAPGSPIAEHWNGTSWRDAALPAGLSGDIGAASAPTGSDVWAVSSQDGYVLYDNGTQWSVAKQFPEPSGELPEELTGVTAFSPTNVWVFGGPGANPGFGTWHLQGTTWTQVTGAGDAITAASALSPTDIWAFGADSNAPDDIILHYDGSTWTQVTSPALDNVQFYSSIVALSPTNVWATGGIAGTTTVTYYLLHMNGTTWTRVKIPWAVSPGRMAPDGSGGLWMTAETTGSTSNQVWVLHRTGAGKWSRTAIPASDFLSDIALVPGTTSLWGAGWTPTRSGTGSNAAIWAYGALP